MILSIWDKWLLKFLAFCDLFKFLKCALMLGANTASTDGRYVIVGKLYSFILVNHINHINHKDE